MMKLFKIDDIYYCKVKKTGTCVETELDVECIVNEVSERLQMRKKSFADMYSRKIIQELFSYWEDMQYEYLTYYVREYISFEEYLYKKELWDTKVIEDVGIKEKETILRLRPQVRNYNATTYMAYDNGMLDMLNELLEGIER